MAQKNITLLIRSALKDENNRLEKMESANHLLDPAHILKRGYSLTFYRGMLIKSVLQLKPGDHIESKWSDGIALSSVNEIHQSKPDE